MRSRWAQWSSRGARRASAPRRKELRRGGSGEAVVREGSGAGSAPRGEEYLLRSVGSWLAYGAVPDCAPANLLPHQLELGLLRRAVHQERDPHRLPARAGIEAAHADVTIAVDSAAFGELHHHAGSVLKIEH